MLLFKLFIIRCRELIIIKKYSLLYEQKKKITGILIFPQQVPFVFRSQLIANTIYRL